MGPVSIGVEVQRNTDGDTQSKWSLVSLSMYVTAFVIMLSNNFVIVASTSLKL